MTSKIPIIHDPDYFICFSTKFIHHNWLQFREEFNLDLYPNPYYDAYELCRLAKEAEVYLYGCRVVIVDKLPKVC